MKSKIYNIINKCCLCVWGFTCFYATTLGMTIIIKNTEFLNKVLSEESAFFFSIFSLCYILYKVREDDDKKNK